MQSEIICPFVLFPLKMDKKIKRTRFICLFFYAFGAYLFMASPIYRLFDKITYNVYYIEISAVLLFTISNITFLVTFLMHNCPIKNRINFTICLIIRILFILGSSSFMVGSIIRIYDSITLKNVYMDLSASAYFSIGCPLDLYLYANKDKQNKKMGSLVHGWSTRIMYVTGSFSFLIGNIYRIFDYVTVNTLYLDIIGTLFFLIPNNMLFIRFIYKNYNNN